MPIRALPFLFCHPIYQEQFAGWVVCKLNSRKSPILFVFRLPKFPQNLGFFLAVFRVCYRTVPNYFCFISNNFFRVSVTVTKISRKLWFILWLFWCLFSGTMSNNFCCFSKRFNKNHENKRFVLSFFEVGFRTQCGIIFVIFPKLLINTTKIMIYFSAFLGSVFRHCVELCFVVFLTFSVEDNRFYSFRSSALVSNSL